MFLFSQFMSDRPSHSRWPPYGREALRPSEMLLVLKASRERRRLHQSELGWKRRCRELLLTLCTPTVKDDFCASHCTMEMEEVVVGSTNLHENQCGQPKHKIDATSWLGRGGGEGDRGLGGKRGKRWSNGVHWSPLELDALLLSWAPWGSWGQSDVGGENIGVKLVDVVMGMYCKEFDQ